MQTTQDRLEHLRVLLKVEEGTDKNELYMNDLKETIKWLENYKENDFEVVKVRMK